jgi:signal transduction histidine kinase
LPPRICGLAGEPAVTVRRATYLLKDDVGGLRRNYLEPVERWRVPAPDVAIALIGLGMAELVVWAGRETIGTPVTGPLWLRALFPLTLALPLAWRRRAPLGAFVVVMGTVVVQGLWTENSPEGFELMWCVGIAMFSAAAYAERSRAVAALVLGSIGYVVYAATNADVRSGRSSDQWAGGFFAIALVATWLVGVYLRSRRLDAAARTRAAALEDEVRQAVTDERARLARELHDVISHNLSAVVVQAAGARATGSADPSTLEKIERSGRESLVEMRRLLGVLRRSDDGPDLAPQPALSDLPALAASLSTYGVPVDLTVEGETRNLSPALELSVYRLVQESLTNVLKHAGPARATVRVDVGPDIVTVDVEDDGGGGEVDLHGGHGLVGMRERVALFDGEVTAGPRPRGGFAVHARLRRRIADR